MIPEHGLRRVPRLDVQGHSRKLTALGWRVFVLPTGIADRRSFFDAIRALMPLDPPVVSHNNWDALSDSLWGGLDGLQTEKIAIIWPDSSAMAELQPEDFEIATSILSDLAQSFAQPEAPADDTKQVLVLIA